MLKYPPCLVIWDDATSDTEVHKDNKKGLTYKPCLTYTVGFLCSQTEEGIVLCTDWVPVLKEFRVRHTIPSGLIKELKILLDKEELRTLR